MVATQCGNLNTSHVILYPMVHILHPTVFSHLNTSHVILYLPSDWNANILCSFKYISCYSLSKYTRLKYIILRNLNTSHVILYLFGNYSHVITQQFKYISCYSLSSLAILSFPPLSLFKYISCYSLSCFVTRDYLIIIYLNTSHVILYHNTEYQKITAEIFKYISCYSLSFETIHL